MAKRVDVPNRLRNARKDASVGAIEKAAAKALGLPAGSVKIVGPKGSTVRSDAKIETLRKRFKKG